MVSAAGGLAPYPLDVPPGGTAGQLLVSSGGTVSSATWQSVAGTQMYVPLYTSGNWYDNRGLELCSPTAALSLSALGSGTIAWSPLFFPTAVTVSALGNPSMKLYSASSGNTLTMAAYTASPTTGMPVTRLGQYTTALTTTTAISSTSAMSFTFPAGWNWIAVGFASTGGGTAYTACHAPAFMQSMFPNNPTGIAAEVSYSLGMGYWQSTTTGTPPATAPTISPVDNYWAPLVSFKVA